MIWWTSSAKNYKVDELGTLYSMLSTQCSVLSTLFTTFQVQIPFYYSPFTIYHLLVLGTRSSVG